MAREPQAAAYPPEVEQHTPHHAAVFAPLAWTHLHCRPLTAPRDAPDLMDTRKEGAVP